MCLKIHINSILAPLVAYFAEYNADKCHAQNRSRGVLKLGGTRRGSVSAL